MYILGINQFHGDSSAANFKDGQLLFAIEEERLRRVKHWAGFPSMAIKACLYYAGIDLNQVDHIAVSRNPSAHIIAKIKHTLFKFKDLNNIKDRLKNQANLLNTRDLLAKEFGISPKQITAKIHFVEHHRAHIASAFFVSPFDHAALLSIDGFGDFTSTMIGFGLGTNIKILDYVIYPHSLGVFYTAFTQWLGFEKYGDEYKVMGLSSYGEPKYMSKMRDIVLLRRDGMFRLNQDYFLHAKHGVSMTWDGGAPFIERLYSPYLEAQFGPPRQKDQPLTQYHMDVAASVQKMTELTLFHILEHLYQLVGVDNLAMAGGVAQNSVANGKIYQNTKFKNVYIPPAATDAGTAIGAALWTYVVKLGNERQFQMNRADWGQEFSLEQIKSVLEKYDNVLEYKFLEDEQLYDFVVDQLIQGKVVGWFHGRTEFGPRALGYRSILADPRNPQAREILNKKIKRREPFRPFAPSILEEYVDEYFEQSYPVPFMEKVFKIRPEKRELIPAVTHVDGTGRLQTVSKNINPKYYSLIHAFYRRTGVPLLLNTSFNENEPIVNTPEEAIKTFLRTRMDILILENYVVTRP